MAASALALVRADDDAAFLLEPNRRRLLGELSRPASAAGLARRLGVPRQRLNHHLRALERGGYIACVEERRKGNCTERLMQATAHAYLIAPAALGDAAAAPAGDQASASFLLAAAARSLSEVGALSERARATGKRLPTFALDTEVRFATAADRAAFVDELAAAVARLVSRFHDERAPAGRRLRCVALLHPPVDRPPDTAATAQGEPHGR